mmetsp:Transcript_122258/g.340993  ORF Transcript_122258/g.340993 Transcript_122258/m.340993 type:complete len:263 (-) Transcript_122258:1121-1909(-)
MCASSAASPATAPTTARVRASRRSRLAARIATSVVATTAVRARARARVARPNRSSVRSARSGPSAAMTTRTMTTSFLNTSIRWNRPSTAATPPAASGASRRASVPAAAATGRRAPASRVKGPRAGGRVSPIRCRPRWAISAPTPSCGAAGAATAAATRAAVAVPAAASADATAERAGAPDSRSSCAATIAGFVQHAPSGEHHGDRNHPVHHQARCRGEERHRPDLCPLRGRRPEDRRRQDGASVARRGRAVLRRPQGPPLLQ